MTQDKARVTEGTRLHDLEGRLLRNSEKYKGGPRRLSKSLLISGGRGAASEVTERSAVWKHFPCTLPNWYGTCT